MNRTFARSFAPFVALAALGGCAPKPFTPPSKGGAPWSEVTTAHFTLDTDLAEGDATAMSADLERMFAALADVGFKATTSPPTHLHVVAFRRDTEYDLIAPKWTFGFFLGSQHGIDANSLAAYWGPLTARTRGVLQHELTHAFVNQYFPGAPAWLHEGFAQYFESLAYEDGYVYVGRAPRHIRFTSGRFHVELVNGEWVADIPAYEALPVADLIKRQGKAFYGENADGYGSGTQRDEAREVTTRYASSWALVHMLLASPTFSGNFTDYLAYIGDSNTRDDAWDRAFPPSVMADLEAEYRGSLLKKEIQVLRMKYEPPPPPTSRPVAMSDDDVLALWHRVGYSPDKHASR